MGCGAWEQQRPEVLLTILTREIVTTRWAIGFRNLSLPPGGDFMFLNGMPFDHARNVGCQRAIEKGYKWLLFLDDDVIPPPDVFFKLSAHNKDIVSGLYYRRAVPVVPVMLKDTDNNKTAWITNFNAPNLMEVDLVGAGCLLISTDALRRIPYPWFEWKVDRYDLPEHQRTSEDFSFCRKARETGYKIYMDTGAQCMHVGYGASTISKEGGTFNPMSVQ